MDRWLTLSESLIATMSVIRLDYYSEYGHNNQDEYLEQLMDELDTSRDRCEEYWNDSMLENYLRSSSNLDY